MRFLAFLALRDLLHNRLQFLCDAALLVGILVPLMVVLGAKTGFQTSLIADLYSDPAILEIRTRGNTPMTLAQRDEILSWPETQFVALRTRAYTDSARVKKLDGDRIQNANIVGTEDGDPLIPTASLSPDEVAVSADLAGLLGLAPGDTLLMVSDSSDRSVQLRIERRIAQVAAPERVPHFVVLADYRTMQMFEAFYEGYALPDYGVTDGRDVATRIEDYEGMRIYARALDEVPALDGKVRQFLAVNTLSRADRIAATLRLGDNLDLAFRVIAIVSIVGLITALASSFWTAVERKRKILATLVLLGAKSRDLALFPIVQAAILCVVSLGLAFMLFELSAAVAESLFEDRLGGSSRVVMLTLSEIATLIFGTVLIVFGSAAVAANRVMGIDPAIILRGET
jgi:putative ABC transport system permease protein